MRALLRGLRTPFGLAVVACLALAGWALWTGGIFDGPIARQVRTSSVYAAPGTGLDRAAAERIIGNRRLVVILLGSSGGLPGTCDSVRHAAAGTLVLVMRKGSDEFETYGCASFGGAFGQSFVAEQLIGEGLDGFTSRPLDAVKVVAVNYDLLVKAGNVPDGARRISPSLPRYLVAAASLLAVLCGSVFVYAAGRRTGRRAAALSAARASAGDARAELGAHVAALAQRIIELDGRSSADRPGFSKIAADYAALLPSLSDPDADVAALDRRVLALDARCRTTDGANPTRPKGAGAKAAVGTKPGADAKAETGAAGGTPGGRTRRRKRR